MKTYRWKVIDATNVYESLLNSVCDLTIRQPLKGEELSVRHKLSKKGHYFNTHTKLILDTEKGKIELPVARASYGNDRVLRVDGLDFAIQFKRNK